MNIYINTFDLDITSRIPWLRPGTRGALVAKSWCRTRFSLESGTAIITDDDHGDTKRSQVKHGFWKIKFIHDHAFGLRMHTWSI